MDNEIEKAKEHFQKVLVEQLDRISKLKDEGDWINYSSLKPIIIGIVGGDGIGPEICQHAKSILEFILSDEIKEVKI